MSGRFRACLPLLFVCGPMFAQEPDAAFFENKIRPVLVAKCYPCHSSKLSSPMGGLAMDTKAGLQKGGASGPVIVAGKPADSKLLHAIRYTNPQLQMPPTGKLPDNVIADFEQWIASGAPDPRVDSASAASPAPLKGMSIEEGRKWWAFQPVKEMPVPRVKNAAWAKNKIDSFILAQLEHVKLPPSHPASPQELVQRAYIDLVGYKPSFEEEQAYVNDHTPHSYENLIDKLLASPHYGERWGRHWMDVARFAEDNPTGEATNPGYPVAWRYRDWIIDALNADMPYDRFVKLQLAADEMPGVAHDDLRALGYIGAAPVYHKDQRLSYDVIYGFMTDDWDERVDAVSRGILGMTVACARCHDHKFDPIPTKDYYAMLGVFASTMRAERPMFEVDPKAEERFLWIQRRLFDLRYSADLLTNEASTVVGAKERVDKWKAEIESLHQEMEGLRGQYPELAQHLERYWTFPPPRQPGAAGGGGGGGRRGNQNAAAREPFFNSVYDAAQFADGSDAHYTFINYKPDEARDLPVMAHGSVTAAGAIEPRHFLTVLSKGDSTFHQGSGRAEFADRVFSDGAPVAARVIVNRVWAWHFGKGLVGTPSDFGTQGERPTHPQLLDDLSARFIAHGWSLKWLNREIVLSAAYRQSSHPRADGEAADSVNALIWRMNPRRMDIESYRDSLLRSAGKLNEEMRGPSEEADSLTNVRRTVYARVSRARVNSLLREYDFPDPIQTAGARDLTVTSLQQLFLMNSAWIHNLASALASSVDSEPDAHAKVRGLYRKILSRDPNAHEMDLALAFLDHPADPEVKQPLLEQYAQILLSTNEEIFWP
jgi:Protein of unknown function (DUF1553)/Protein of unknown function (DUF1549)/Planctomycete cytochrome C